MKVGKPCDTCGYNGFHDYAITCSRCGLLRHMYCMMVSVIDVREAWVCEECLSKNELGSLSYSSMILNPSAAKHSAPTKACLDSGLQIPEEKSNAVQTGKVKYLPIEEVLRLSINSLDLEPHLHNNHRGKFARRNPVASQRFSPKISFLDLKENYEATSSRAVKPSRGAATINTKPNQHEVIPGETSPALAENKNSASEDEEPKLELYLENQPALQATWKGDFKFFDAATTSGQFYGGFQAQPPCLVHPKVYDFSRKLPSILQVKLLPRSQIWSDLFGNDCPDFDDIAFYIYPSDNMERSKNNYSSLLELLETQDSVMTCHLNGMELLICASKQLHVDCQRFIKRINIGDFLWAVFRGIETDQNVSKSEEEIASLISCQRCASDDDAYTRSTEIIDMDIDMEGGKEVGRIDVVVPKELPRKEFRNNKEGDLSLAIEQTDSELKKGKRKDSSVHSKCSEKIEENIILGKSQGNSRNSKDEVDFPPGFEEKIWVNLGGKGSVTKGNWNVIEEIKIENLDFPGLSEPKSSEKIKENIISEWTLDKTQGNLRNSKDEVGFPPGFEEKAWMNLRGKGSVTKDNWNVTKERKKRKCGSSRCI